MPRQGSLLLLALLLIFASGCASSSSPSRSQALQEYDRQLSSFKTIGVLLPDMLMFELTAGGVRELIDEWCALAGKNFTTAVEKELQGRSVKFKMLPLDPSRDIVLEEIYYLNRAVSESLRWNTTYRKLATCADPRVCRDYSVGPVTDILQKNHVDALLIIFGQNELETENRTAARKRSRAVSFWSSFGPVRVEGLRNPGTQVSMALIDPSGSIFWFSGMSTGKGYDLREPAVAAEVTKKILSRMWLKEQAGEQQK